MQRFAQLQQHEGRFYLRRFQYFVALLSRCRAAGEDFALPRGRRRPHVGREMQLACELGLI
jgi:hypothetical protein